MIIALKELESALLADGRVLSTARVASSAARSG